MNHRAIHEAAVAQIVPAMFDSIRQDFQLPIHTNLAASNQCHVLTKGLHIALSGRNLDARREFHQDEEGIWHYLIAHHPMDSLPRDDDIITDLNPWQFMQKNLSPNFTYLHGERGEIMDRLASEGAPDYFIALRGLATIRKKPYTYLK
jgi:hypothetical protein